MLVERRSWLSAGREPYPGSEGPPRAARRWDHRRGPAIGERADDVHGLHDRAGATSGSRPSGATEPGLVGQGPGADAYPEALPAAGEVVAA